MLSGVYSDIFDAFNEKYVGKDVGGSIYYCIRLWHLYGGTGSIYCWQLQDINPSEMLVS